MAGSARGIQNHLNAIYNQAGQAQQSNAVNSDSDTKTVVPLLTLLWSRKWLIATIAFIVTLLTAFVVLQIPKVYTANSQVMLNARESNVIDLESVISGLPADTAAVQSEVEILQSQQLIEKVVERLALIADPEFNEALKPPSKLFAWFPKEGIRVFLTEVGVMRPEVAPVVDTSRPPQDVVDAVKKNLTVRPVGLSLVINIAFKSEDPQQAARVANAIVEQYLLEQLEAKFSATQRATEWLSTRIDDLRANVEIAEAAVETYKASQNIVLDSDGVSIANRQMAELNSSLVDARAQRAEAEARYSQVASLVQSGGAASAADVLSSPLIQSLREQEAQVRRREAELATRYGERHPTMINIRAEAADLAARIETEVSKIVQNLQNEVQVAAARQNSLQSSVDALEREVMGQSQASIRLNQLEREARAARLIYESFLARFKETTEQESIQQADVRIISEARPPNKPSAPKVIPILGMASVAGVGLGIMLVVLFENLRITYRSSREMEAATGVHVIGQIPHMPSRKAKQILVYARENPESQIVEAIRALRTSLFLQNPSTKRVMITSSIPGEGKSTMAMLLALNVSRMGKRVLIVDCDLRRPTAHKFLPNKQINRKVGLVQYLAGDQEDYSDMLVHSDFDVMLSGDTSARDQNPADMLSSGKFEAFLEKASKEYDLIILDTPPVLAVADARIVGVHVDTCLYVYKWDSTHKYTFEQGVNELADTGIAVGGIVMNNINFAKQATYGYGNYQSYAQKYYR
jgi:capsular exopolysaccharide synthesis family protein